MPNMCEKTVQKKDKAVCNTIDAAAVATIETVVDLVKAAYTDTYPLGTEVLDEHDNEPQNLLHFDDDNDWNVDNSTPWIDVTWHKRGFTSMYGIAVVIDILIGYVTDYEVLSKYCHACAISKSKDMTDNHDKPGMLDMPPSASSTTMVLPKPWREKQPKHCGDVPLLSMDFAIVPC